MTILLGDIQFLNSWPVTYALREGLIESAVSIASGAPAELNRRLLSAELDASAVSSWLLVRHPGEFLPLRELCIRCDGAVGSVLVVSRRPIQELKKGTIAVTNQGATTPVLLKILLRREGLRSRPEVTSLRYPEVLEEHPAALLIGDEALAAAQSSQELYRWDLGEAWSRWTRLPFVFALWVIRRNVMAREPQLQDELEERLLASYEWGRTHQKELVAAMRKVFPWEANFLRAYLDRISYVLDARAWAGLVRFSKEAEKIGEAPKGTTREILRMIRNERLDRVPS